jgi:hypothetical protein
MGDCDPLAELLECTGGAADSLAELGILTIGCCRRTIENIVCSNGEPAELVGEDGATPTCTGADGILEGKPMSRGELST